jgi:hypothetical protein
MVIRWNGHDSSAITVDLSGNIIKGFTLNNTPNQTGMEVVYWQGHEEPAVLCNGDCLWDPINGRSWRIPELPLLRGHERMGWYHCISADLDGDGRDEIVLYNPWDDQVHIYGARPAPGDHITGFAAGTQQYNPRLMD